MPWHEIDLIVARMLLYSTNIAYSKYILPKISRIFYETWQLISPNLQQLISLNRHQLISDFLILANTVLNFNTKDAKNAKTQINKFVNTRHIIINDKLYWKRVSKAQINLILTSYVGQLLTIDIRYSNTIEDSDVKCIANMPRLKSLKLLECNYISDLSMVYISTNTTLTSLSMIGWNIKGIHVSSLHTCTSLKTLRIRFEFRHYYNSHDLDNMRQPIKNIDFIKWPIKVNINKLSITTQMLTYVLLHLPVIPSVTHLDLTDVFTLAGAHFKHMPRCFPNITSIVISRSMFINQHIGTALNYIKQFTYLRRITMDILDFHYSDIAQFFELFSEQLTHLTLTSHEIFHRYIKRLNGSPNILHLKLDVICYVSATLSMIYITDCSNIINLSLVNCSLVQNNDLKYLDRLKHLQKIEFINAQLLTNDCVSYLLPCLDLIKIKLEGCKYINNMIATRLVSCDKLIKVKFENCKLISNNIISMLPNIPVIIVKHCAQISH
jgi:hypothetical protein